MVSPAIFGHLEAFWNKKYLTKCVQNLILYKIKVLKLSQNASKWPKMAGLTIPAAQIKSGTKHIVQFHIDGCSNFRAVNTVTVVLCLSTTPLISLKQKIMDLTSIFYLDLVDVSNSYPTMYVVWYLLFY